MEDWYKKKTWNESFCVCRAFGLTELLHLPLASMWLRQLRQLTAVSGGSGDVVPDANRAFHLMAAKWWCEHQRVPINTCFKSRYHSVTASSATSWSTNLNSFVLIEPGAQMTRFLFKSQWLTRPSAFIKAWCRICLKHLITAFSHIFPRH